MIKFNVTNLARQFGLANDRLSTSLERLASGKRLNRSSDDPSGLAFANNVRSRISGLSSSLQNARDGVSMAQTADAALGKINDDIVRMQELATQYQSDTFSDDQKLAIKEEFDQLAQNIKSTADSTEFNGHKLLGADGDESIEVTHANGAMSTEVRVDVTDARDLTLDDADIEGSIQALDDAATTVANKRAKLGALEERLDSSIENLDVQVEAGEATYSRVADANYATEVANLVREQVMLQAGIALFAHGQMNSKNVLNLLE
jgi:flagellin